MKRLLILLVCALSASLLPGGCQELSRDKKKPVEVIIEGGGEFPHFLVGRWKSNKGFWEFVFEPDGEISSAAIWLGGVEMTPGKTSKFPTRYGGKGEFIPGPWFVQYSPDARELLVIIKVKHFYMDMGRYAAEGNSDDLLVGPISQDGKTWQADWYSSGQYIAHVPDPNRFYDVNPNEPEFRGSLVFEKVKQEKGKSRG